MVGVNGSHQPRALVVALRKIAKDPKATVTQRLRACELQAIIAGYIEGQNQATSARTENSNGHGLERRPSPANIQRLKELAAQLRAEGHEGLWASIPADVWVPSV